MIVGCYTMYLYCVHWETLPTHYGSDPTPAGYHRYAAFPHGFEGKSERACKTAARRAGWKFTNGDVICPHCRANPIPDTEERKL